MAKNNAASGLNSSDSSKGGGGSRERGQEANEKGADEPIRVLGFWRADPKEAAKHFRRWPQNPLGLTENSLVIDDAESKNPRASFVSFSGLYAHDPNGEHLRLGYGGGHVQILDGR